MLRLTLLALGASVAVGVLAPEDAAAQLTGRERAAGGRRDSDRDRRGDVIWDERRRADSRRDGRWDDRDSDSDSDSDRRGNGPPFCRDGRGHPVHGREWCRDKGWDDRDRRYSRSVWDDIILRRPRDVARRDLGRSALEQILGSVVLGRFDQHRLRLGARQPLRGRWYDTSSGSLLRLYSGSTQVAQIFDRNRDGRSDQVVLNYNRY